MRKLFVLFVFVCCPFFAFGKGLSVVIVGGGPAGLATAIEAHEHGADVTIIEKRAEYSRLRLLFLSDVSIKLLEDWKVKVSHMHIAHVDKQHKMAFVSTQDLENGLAKRVEELGIRKIIGTFKQLKPNNVVVVVDQKEKSIPYDIVVAADGVKSSVREALGIKYCTMGKSLGSWALLDSKSEVKEIDITLKKGDDYYVRKITTPAITLFLLQSSLQSLETLPQKRLEMAARDFGWKKEAELIAKSEATISENFEIVLTQAEKFSDEKRHAILIGDAAACASFIQGKGVNKALKCASESGLFFKKIQERDPTAYTSFNQMMQEVTDRMIENSQFLFE